jgi:hypothetical protein
MRPEATGRRRVGGPESAPISDSFVGLAGSTAAELVMEGVVPIGMRVGG